MNQLTNTGLTACCFDHCSKLTVEWMLNLLFCFLYEKRKSSIRSTLATPVCWHLTNCSSLLGNLIFPFCTA